jgi:hypothetical protein
MVPPSIHRTQQSVVVLVAIIIITMLVAFPFAGNNLLLDGPSEIRPWNFKIPRAQARNYRWSHSHDV